MLSPTQQTHADGNAALLAALTIAEAIREAGRIPSGTLYAVLMGKIDLEGYGRIIRSLQNAGLIKVVAHELIWTGGEHV